MSLTTQKIIGMAVIAIIAFSYGIIVDHFRIFPYDAIRETKIAILNDKNFQSKDYNQIIYENDTKSLIHISEQEDVVAKRMLLYQYLWPKEGFPFSKMPSSVEKNIVDPRYEDIDNLKNITKLTIQMDYDVNSIAYLFSSQQSNNKLVIYHQGHDGDFYKGKSTIQFFLNQGYSVLALSMPLMGMNNQPVVDVPEFGKIKLTSHDHFQFLKNENFSPIKYFIEPVVVSLNYLDNQFNFDSYYMVGLSGGGWTTILSAAIDDRISQSYSVAGSVPIYLRSNVRDLGDYEQIEPDLYHITNYLDLYVLGAFGDNRKLILIYNKYDSCCFAGEGYKTFESEITNTVNHLGKGKFEVYLDDTHNQHMISPYTLNLIKDLMNK